MKTKINQSTEITKIYFAVYDKEDVYSEGDCLEVFDTENEAKSFVNSENAGYGYNKLYYKEESLVVS